MGVYRIPFVLTYDDKGSPGANVWHVRTGAIGTDQANVEAAASSILTFYNDLGSHGANPMREGVSWRAEAAFSEENDTVLDLTPVKAGASGTAGPDAPPVLAICISWSSTSRTRRGRGRTFLGPLNQACIQEDGTIAAAHLTVVQNAANALCARNNADNGWAVGVWGLQNSGGNAASPHVLRDFQSAKVRDQFAVLRSRRD